MSNATGTEQYRVFRLKRNPTLVHFPVSSDNNAKSGNGAADSRAFAAPSSGVPTCRAHHRQQGQYMDPQQSMPTATAAAPSHLKRGTADNNVTMHSNNVTSASTSSNSNIRPSSAAARRAGHRDTVGSLLRYSNYQQSTTTTTTMALSKDNNKDRDITMSAAARSSQQQHQHQHQHSSRALENHLTGAGAVPHGGQYNDDGGVDDDVPIRLGGRYRAAQRGAGYNIITGAPIHAHAR